MAKRKLQVGESLVKPLRGRKLRQVGLAIKYQPNGSRYKVGFDDGSVRTFESEELQEVK